MEKTPILRTRTRGRKRVSSDLRSTILRLACEWDEVESRPMFTYNEISNVTGVSVSTVFNIARNVMVSDKRRSRYDQLSEPISQMLSIRDAGGRRLTYKEIGLSLNIHPSLVHRVIKITGIKIPPLSDKPKREPIDWEQKTAKRFWSKVKKSDGCWEWKGALTKEGYGRFSWTRNAQCGNYAHRASWLIIQGPIPEGLSVLHHCDNRKCVNPSHLYIGTQADNCHDRDSRGRNGIKGRRIDHARKHEVTQAYAYWIEHKDESKASCARKYNCSASSLYSRIKSEQKIINTIKQEDEECQKKKE